MCNAHCSSIPRSGRQSFNFVGMIWWLTTAVFVLLKSSAVEVSKASGLEETRGVDTDKVSRFVWILYDHTSTTDIEDICKQLNMRGARCIARGHPEKGGLPFLVVSATVIQIQLAISEGKIKELTLSVEEDFDESLEGAAGSVAGSSTCRYTEVEKVMPWHLRRIRVRGLRDLDSSNVTLKPFHGAGHGVHVYLFGSGINFEHVDLQGRAIPGIDTTSGSLEECFLKMNCSIDANGQGTSLASLIGGYHYGIAPGALLHSVKILDGNGRGSVVGAMLALDWLLIHAEYPAVVVLGFMKRGESKSLELAMESLFKSFVVIAEAGDASERNACDVSPARMSKIITVAATDRNDELADFSSTGADCIDLLAPGTVVAAGANSPQSCRKFESTGAAAALVAGMAAVIIGDDPSRTPEVVEGRLLQDASRIGADPNKLLFASAYSENPGLLRTARKVDLEAHEDDSLVDDVELVSLYPYNDFAWAFRGHSEQCATGVEQSPIDLPKCEPSLGVRGDDFPVGHGDRVDEGWVPQDGLVEVLDNTVTLRMYGGPLSHIQPRKNFRMRECHFHVPSQHRIDHSAHAMEMECIHDGDDGALGVISFLFDNSSTYEVDNSLLGVIIDSFPNSLARSRRLREPFNFAQLGEHMRQSRLYRYEGSLTQPPCTEKVFRIVVESPLPVSNKQVHQFTAAMGVASNARSVQPLRDRCVFACSNECAKHYDSVGRTSSHKVLAGVATMSAVYKLRLVADDSSNWQDRMSRLVSQMIAGGTEIPTTAIVVKVKRMVADPEQIHVSALLGLTSTTFPSVKEISDSVKQILAHHFLNFGKFEDPDLNELMTGAAMVKFYFNKPSTSLGFGGRNLKNSMYPDQENGSQLKTDMLGPSLQYKTLSVPPPNRNYGRASCRCIGIAGLDGATQIVVTDHAGVSQLANYPAEIGSSCHAWDDGFHPIHCMRPDQDPGKGNGWCKQAWCFVDPCACDLPEPPLQSQYLPAVKANGRPLYYSYLTCADPQYPTMRTAGRCLQFLNKSSCEPSDVCAWSEEKRRCLTKEIHSICAQTDVGYQVVGKSSCQCVGFEGIPGQVKVWLDDGKIVEYPAAHGSSCSSWDDGNYLGKCTASHGEDPGRGKGDCAKRWCYVDPCQCDLHTVPKLSEHLPFAAYQGRPLIHSYQTCAGADTPMQVSFTCRTLTSNESCVEISKGECEWTSFGCVRAALLPFCQSSFALTTEHQMLDQTPLVVQGLRECPCIGISGIKGLTQANLGGDLYETYPRDVGSHCEAWDNERYPGLCQDGDTPGPHKGVCAQRWCFVDPCNCNLAENPIRSTYFPGAMARGKPLYYSYATCLSNSTFRDANLEETVDPSAKPAFALGKTCGHEQTKDECVTHVGCAWEPDRSVPGSGVCVEFAVAKTCDAEPLPQVWGQQACPCVGIKGLNGLIQARLEGWTIEYPADVGSHCRAWHIGHHPSCPQDTDDPLCTSRWCFVDPCTCSSSTFFERNLLLPMALSEGRKVYVSNMTCGSEAMMSSVQAKLACSRSKTRQDCDRDKKCGWTGHLCVDSKLDYLCSLADSAQTTTTTTLFVLAGHDRCPCIGFAGAVGEVLLRVGDSNLTVNVSDPSYGSRCDYWDDGLLSGFCENADQSPGVHNGFCGKMWCFVDPCNCAINELPSKSKVLPKMTFRGKPLFYSYETCADFSYWNGLQQNTQPVCRELATMQSCTRFAECSWFEEDSGPARCMGKAQADACKPQIDLYKFGRPDCQCVGLDGMVLGGIDGVFRGANVRYPYNVGSHCDNWEMKHNLSGEFEHSSRQCTDADPPPWCKRFCFVDPCQCHLSVPPTLSNMLPGTYWQGKPLFLSYETCGSTSPVVPNPDTVCENKIHPKPCEELAGCDWTGHTCVRVEFSSLCNGIDWPTRLNESAVRTRARQAFVPTSRDSSNPTIIRVDNGIITAESVTGGAKLIEEERFDDKKYAVVITEEPRHLMEGSSVGEPEMQKTTTEPNALANSVGKVHSARHLLRSVDEMQTPIRPDVGVSLTSFASCGTLNCGSRWHRYVERGGEITVNMCHGPTCTDERDMETCCTVQANCASHVCPVEMVKRPSPHARLCAGPVCDIQADLDTCCFSPRGSLRSGDEIQAYLILLLGLALALAIGACYHHMFQTRQIDADKVSFEEATKPVK